MYIVHVSIQVKPEYIDDFIEATITNASNSVMEPGIARFDFIQDLGDPSKFLLLEVYRTPDDPAKHKAAPHYAVWRDTVEPMMAEPRTSQKFANLFPTEDGWE